MKILISTSTFPRWEGDATTPFILSFARYVQKQGNEVYVLAPHFPGAKKFEIMRGVRVYRFQYAWPARCQMLTYGGGALLNLEKSKLSYLLAAFFVLSQLLNLLYLNLKHKFDVINAHWILPQGFTALLAGIVFRLPVVVTVHGGAIYGLKNSLFVAFKKLVLRRAHKVLANSTATCDACKALCSKQNVTVIPTAIPTKDFLPSCADKSVRDGFGIDSEFLLFVGRIIEAKGLDYLIKAMPLVLNRFPKAKLLIVGEGPAKQKYVEQVKEAGLENSVLFAGWVDNHLLPKYYASADVFVGPSITTEYGWKEALGVVFIESLACGTPVVATKVGGITDTVQDGVTGLLVEEKNSEDIAKAVLKLLEGKEYARKLAETGRKYVLSKYDSAETAEKVNRVFKEMIS